jgi:hypothetical protein
MFYLPERKKKKNFWSLNTTWRLSSLCFIVEFFTHSFAQALIFKLHIFTEQILGSLQLNSWNNINENRLTPVVAAVEQVICGMWPR